MNKELPLPALELLQLSMVIRPVTDAPHYPERKASPKERVIRSTNTRQKQWTWSLPCGMYILMGSQTRKADKQMSKITVNSGECQEGRDKALSSVRRCGLLSHSQEAGRPGNGSGGAGLQGRAGQ